MQRAINKDCLNYIEETLKENSKKLKAAVERAIMLRQNRKYVDDDLKVDLCYLKTLLSDVQQSKSEVHQ